MASSIMDLLGGGGGAPPAGGPPPSIPDPEPHLAPGAQSGGGGGDALAALLGGGSGSDPDAAADASGVGDTDAATEADEGPGPKASEAPNSHMASEISTLKQMIGLADGFKKIKTVEPDEAAKMAGVSKTLHDLLAANQKGQDSLSGANPAMRKALGPRGA